MLKLMSLELKKCSLKFIFLINLFIIVGICFCMTAGMLSSKDLNNGAAGVSYPNMFITCNNFIVYSYLIFYTSIVSKIVIQEYTQGTILVLYTYPVSKKKLMTAKLLLIMGFTALSTLIGNTIGMLYIIINDYFFDFVIGVLNYQVLIIGLEYIMVGVLTSVVFILVPFIIGILKKNVSYAFISSILTVLIIQTIVSQCKNIIQLGEIIIVIGVMLALVTFHIFRKYVTLVDSI